MSSRCVQHIYLFVSYYMCQPLLSKTCQHFLSLFLKWKCNHFCITSIISICLVLTRVDSEDTDLQWEGFLYLRGLPLLAPPPLKRWPPTYECRNDNRKRLSRSKEVLLFVLRPFKYKFIFDHWKKLSPVPLFCKTSLFFLIYIFFGWPRALK